MAGGVSLWLAQRVGRRTLEGGRPALHRARKGAHLARRAFCAPSGAMEGGTPSLQSGVGSQSNTNSERGWGDNARLAPTKAQDEV